MLKQQFYSWCNCLSVTLCQPQHLKLLKEQFKRDINSPRRYDNIHSIFELIKILEKRDCLNLDNIEPLKVISNVLNVDYTQFLHDRLDNRDRTEERVQEPRSNQLGVGINGSSMESRIFLLICSEIGQKWTELARALGVREGDIDSLEYRYNRNIPSMVLKVLEMYKYEEDERYWFVNLQKALVKARRRDLSDRVGQLYARYQH